MIYSTVEKAISSLQDDPDIIEQARKGTIMGVYSERSGFTYRPTEHKVNPGKTRLSAWTVLPGKDAAFLFGEPLEAACFLAIPGRWHTITIIAGTPWIAKVETELVIYFSSQERINYLNQKCELLEPRMTMDYTPHYSKRSQRATCSAEEFTVKRASITRELNDLIRIRARTGAALEKISNQQVEVLVRRYRNRESLRSAAGSMRLSVREFQQQGYKAMKTLAACL